MEDVFNSFYLFSSIVGVPPLGYQQWKEEGERPSKELFSSNGQQINEDFQINSNLSFCFETVLYHSFIGFIPYNLIIRSPLFQGVLVCFVSGRAQQMSAVFVQEETTKHPMFHSNMF